MKTKRLLFDGRHVVVQIGNDEGDRGKLIEIARRKLTEIQAVVHGVAETPPCFMIGCGIAGFGIAPKAVARLLEFASKRRSRRKIIGVVVRDPLRRSGVHREIIRLAWMADREVIGEERALRGKRIHERGIGAADDVLKALIFVDDHDDVRWGAGGNRARHRCKPVGQPLAPAVKCLVVPFVRF